MKEYIKSRHLIAALISIFIIIIFGFYLIGYLQDYKDEHSKAELVLDAKYVAFLIDYQTIKSLNGTSGDIGTDAYKHLHDDLIRFKQTDYSVKTVHLVAKKGTDFIILVDSEVITSSEHSMPGDIYEEATLELNNIFTNGMAYVEGPFENQQGTWVFGHAPIIDPNTNEIIAVVVLEIDANEWAQELAIFRWLGISSIILLICLSLLYSVYMFRITFSGIKLKKSYELTDAISRVQSKFILEFDPKISFDRLLTDILSLTDSEYGFIGEICHTPEGTPYLKSHALTNIAWNKKTQEMYEENSGSGIEFRNLKTLYGDVITSGEFIISNDAVHDPRRGPIPEGHPALNTFLGVPCYVGDDMVAMIGLANRPNGYDRKFVDFLEPFVITCANIIEAYRNDQKRKQVEESLKNLTDELETKVEKRTVELQSTARELSQLIETVNVLIIVIDLQGHIRGWNRQSFITLGYTKEEVMDKDMVELFCRGDSKEIVIKNIELVFSGKNLNDAECTFYSKDGKPVIILWNATPRKDLMGNIIGCVGIGQDVTKRKKAEDALNKSEQMATSIMESAPEGMIVIAEDLKITMVNNQVEHMLGYKKSELIGNFHDFLIPERFREKHSEHMINFISNPILRPMGMRLELIIVKKNGDEIPVEVGLSPVNTSKGKIVISSIRDITERKEVERLRIENLGLAYASKAKSEFLANMSHELRTPLNSIMGFSELLNEKIAGELNDKQEHYIDNIHNSGKFLLGLINDILDISKVEAGKVELKIEKIKMSRTMKEVITLVKEKALKHNIILKTEYDPKLDVIEADRQRIKQVLFNLLSNALKFSKLEGGTVTITTKKEGKLAKISVHDTGIGIKKEDINRLFKEFQQLESTTTKQHQGTGLGLAISKKLVELHGGTIFVESEYGVGSTFVFAVPIKAVKHKENQDENKGEDK